MFAVTWAPGGNRATAAPYTITTSAGTTAPILVDQTAPPIGFLSAGDTWDPLGVVTVTGGVLSVDLSDAVSGYVVADAVRVQRVDRHVVDLLDESSAVDDGDVNFGASAGYNALHSGQRNLPYHEVERERLGFDHGELGALLIREWNLSPELEEAVRWHHSFADHPESPIAAMIALGEDIARCSSSGEEIAEAEAGEAAGLLGLDPDQVEELKARAAELQIDPHFFN